MQNDKDQLRFIAPEVWLPIFCLSGLLCVIYYSSYANLLHKWSLEDYNYCYLILPITLYLIGEKRTSFLKTPSSLSWHGLIFIVFGLILFWLGELGGEFFSQYLSSWLILAGVLWTFFGWKKFRIILFPIAFILTMFPPPDFIYFNLSLKLKLISSRLGVWFLQSLGKTAYREGNIIDLGFTQLQVVDACNGLRYLFPLIVLAILVAYFDRAAWWKKGLVVLSSIPISIFVNGLRIASVGLLYPIWGPSVTEGFFHDFSGWAIFMISLGILLSELWLLDFVFKEKSVKPKAISESQKKENPASGIAQSAKLKAQEKEHGQKAQSELQNTFEKSRGTRAGKLGLFQPQFIVAMVLLGATAAIAQTVNFREEVPIARSFHQFPLGIGSWTGQLQSMDQEFIDELDLSDYIMVNFRNGSNPSINFYTAYYESQRKGESIHSPSSCLPGSGWEFHQAGRVEIPLSKPDAHTIAVNRAVMSNVGLKQLSYYWFPMRGRIATTLWQVKLYNFWDALTRQRTDGALVRLITPIGRNEKVEEADARLQAFTRELVPVLDQFLPN